jgi:hypothetical protein
MEKRTLVLLSLLLVVCFQTNAQVAGPERAISANKLEKSIVPSKEYPIDSRRLDVKAKDPNRLNGKTKERRHSQLEIKAAKQASSIDSSEYLERNSVSRQDSRLESIGGEKKNRLVAPTRDDQKAQESAKAAQKAAEQARASARRAEQAARASETDRHGTVGADAAVGSAGSPKADADYADGGNSDPCKRVDPPPRCKK